MAEAEFLIVEAIYPGMTQLDFTGPHTIFSRIPGARVDRRLRARRADRDPTAASSSPERAGWPRSSAATCCSCPAASAATDVANDDASSWREFRRLAASARYLTSVCTGSLILGAAGLLQGQARRLPLGLARPAAAVRRDPRSGARGARRQHHHRRRRHRGHRLRAGRRGGARRRERWRSRCSSRSNTRLRRRSTPAGRKRRRPKCSPWCRRGSRRSSPSARRRRNARRRGSSGRALARRARQETRGVRRASSDACQRPSPCAISSSTPTPPPTTPSRS